MTTVIQPGWYVARKHKEGKYAMLMRVYRTHLNENTQVAFRYF